MRGRPRTFDWEAAIAMIEDGHTLADVMARFDCNYTTLLNARRTLGSTVKFPSGHRPLDDERVAVLYRRGWTRREIAAELDVCTKTIARSIARINR